MDNQQVSTSRLEQLSFRVVEGLAEPHEVQELETLILNAPDAVEFYTRYARVHAKLRFINGTASRSGKDHSHFLKILSEEASQSDANLSSQLHASVRSASKDACRVEPLELDRGETRSSGPRVIVIPRWVVIWPSVAAVLMLGFWMHARFVSSTNNTGPDPTAQLEVHESPQQSSMNSTSGIAQAQSNTVVVSGVRGAAWADGSIVSEGTVLEPRDYSLAQGLVRLEYASGVEVILQSPIDFRHISDDLIEITSGVASIRVVPGAEGYTVKTPSAQLVDLGTRFGVEVRQGQTTLQVLSGKVRMEHVGTAAAQRTFVGGEAARIDLEREAFETEIYRPQLFPTEWDQTQLGVQCDGSGFLLFSPPDSVTPGSFESNDRVFIFKEQSGLTLRENLPVDIATTGRVDRFKGRSAPPISAGTSIDSYFVHFDPIGQKNDLLGAEAEFVFEQPILGLIVRKIRLTETDGFLRLPGVTYLSEAAGNNGLEGKGMTKTPDAPGVDYLHLSSDRKTLHLHLAASLSIDQLRIITASGPDATE